MTRNIMTKICSITNVEELSIFIGPKYMLSKTIIYKKNLKIDVCCFINTHTTIFSYKACGILSHIQPSFNLST